VLISGLLLPGRHHREQVLATENAKRTERDMRRKERRRRSSFCGSNERGRREDGRDRQRDDDGLSSDEGGNHHPDIVNRQFSELYNVDSVQIAATARVCSVDTRCRDCCTVCTRTLACVPMCMRACVLASHVHRAHHARWTRVDTVANSVCFESRARAGGVVPAFVASAT